MLGIILACMKGSKERRVIRLSITSSGVTNIRRRIGPHKSISKLVAGEAWVMEERAVSLQAPEVILDVLDCKVDNSNICKTLLTCPQIRFSTKAITAGLRAVPSCTMLISIKHHCL